MSKSDLLIQFVDHIFSNNGINPNCNKKLLGKLMTQKWKKTIGIHSTVTEDALIVHDSTNTIISDKEFI